MTKPLKTWMVEGRCKLPNGMIAPVRSVIEAATKKLAKTGANNAVDLASKFLAEEHGLKETPKRMGDAVVLYPI